MTLDQALDYIHRVDWRGSVPGLSRIDTLLGKLGHPERYVKYIHITGTNGKGSTCAMTAAILRAAGYKPASTPPLHPPLQRADADQRCPHPR